MSFFNRQLYKQKPQAWGPVSSVQASVFKNVERVGIDPVILKCLMPFWSPGNQFDYAYNIFHTISGNPVFKNNNIVFDGSGDYISANSVATRLSDGRYHGTLMIKMTPQSLPPSERFFISMRNGSSGARLFIKHNASELLVGWNDTLTYSTGENLLIGQSELLTLTWNAPFVGLYRGENLVWSISETLSSTPNNFAISALSSAPSLAYHANQAVDIVFVFDIGLDASQIAYIADNPYFLLHRVDPVFYSVPGGAITITTSLDGKVIIRTTTSSLLDCMASIKNNANNILDGAAVVSTTKSDAIDCKTILKSVASSIFDSKASVLSIAEVLLDGNAVISDTGSFIFDGKGTVKDSTYDIVDGKSIVKSNNTAILDGKSIFLSTGTTVIDGKIIVNADGFSSSLLDGKTSIKSVATNYLDGLIYIGNAADKNIDGKAIIKSSVGMTMDGKTTIKDVASNLLNGYASIMTSVANIVDGKIIVSDAAIGLLDGNASIMDDSSIVLDGKVFLSSGSEINIFDGRITLSVPIVGKVTVSFSMRSPSVSFSIKTPAAIFSIN